MEFCRNPNCFDFETGERARARTTGGFCSGACYHETRRGVGNGKNYIRIRVWKDCPACRRQQMLLELEQRHVRQSAMFVLREIPVCKRCNGRGEISIRVYLHRWKMEQMIGRELEPGEVVHHLDFNIYNNDESNLYLFESQAAHLEFHRANTRPMYRNGDGSLHEIAQYDRHVFDYYSDIPF